MNFLGYDTGGCDGIYGAKTQKAVQEFARSSGIENQWEITQTYLDMLYVSVVQKVKDMPDEVLDAGLAALEKKLTTGGWW